MDLGSVLQHGLVLEQQGRLTEAAEHYGRGLEANPGSAELGNALRRVYEPLRSDIEKNLHRTIDELRLLWTRLREYDKALDPTSERAPPLLDPHAPPPLPPMPMHTAPPAHYATPYGGGPPAAPTAPHVRVTREDVIAAHNAQFATRTRTAGSSPSSKLFAAVPKSASETQVRETFSWLPGYRGADLKTAMGQSKGYAFVQFGTVREAVDAREYLDGLVIAALGPRPLSINFSTVPLPDLPAGGMPPAMGGDLSGMKRPRE